MTKLGSGGGLSSGWGKRKFKKVMKSERVVKAVDAKSKAVQEYWKSISPVFDAGNPAEHRKTPPRGHIGSYRDSIKVFDISDDDGPRRRVKPTDWKSKMIEFGHKHMPEYAPMAKTKAKFRK